MKSTLKTGTSSPLLTVLVITTALLILTVGAYKVGEYVGRTIVLKSQTKVQAAIDSTPALPSVATEKTLLKNVLASEDLDSAPAIKHKTANPAPESDVFFQYRLGQTVKAVQKHNMFTGCVGKIVNGYVIEGGPMYIIKLSNCPYDSSPKNEIKAGQEYLNLISTTKGDEGLKEVSNGK